MEHKKRLEELNQESLQRIDEYVKTREKIKEEDHARFHKAKDEWQAAWNKMIEAMMVLERLEI
jgi:hypothetical protein